MSEVDLRALVTVDKSRSERFQPIPIVEIRRCADWREQLASRIERKNEYTTHPTRLSRVDGSKTYGSGS